MQFHRGLEPNGFEAQSSQVWEQTLPPWPHLKQSPRKSSSSTNILGLTSSDHQENHQQKISLPKSCHLQWIKYDHMIHGLIRWWNSGRKLKCHEKACLKFSPPSPTWDQHLQLPSLKHLPEISGGHHSYHWSQLSSIWSFETWVSRRGLLESRVWSKPTGNICGAWEWEERKLKKDKYWK